VSLLPFTRSGFNYRQIGRRVHIKNTFSIILVHSHQEEEKGSLINGIQSLQKQGQVGFQSLAEAGTGKIPMGFQWDSNESSIPFKSRDM